MKALKYQWLLMLRKPFHSACLFLLIFLFGCFSILSAFLWNIVDSYRSLVVLDTGYTIDLNREDDSDIPAEDEEKIQSIHGVTGINRTASSLAQPLNFVNFVDSSDQTDAFDSAQATQVKLVGNLYAEHNLTFQTYGTLTDGIYPDSEHPGALISADLAEANGLSLGDQLSLRCEGSACAYSMTIIGIYALHAPIQENILSDSGYEVYGDTPYSYIFCDLPSFASAAGIELYENSLSIYAGNLRSLKTIYQELCDLGYDSEPYRLFNVTEDQINYGTISAQSITGAAQIMSWITTITTVAIVFLLIVLWMRNDYKDIAILISIGKSRGRIAFDYLLLCTVMICLALLCAGPVCAAVLHFYGNNLLQYVMHLMRETSTVETDALIQRAMTGTMRFSNYAAAELKLLGLAEAAMLLGMGKIFSCKPTILFHTS